MGPKDVMNLIKSQNIEFVDLQFGDMFGKQQHFTVPVKAFEEKFFEIGVPFDGSSIRAWRSIEASDMLLKPDASSAILDPFRKLPTIIIMCDVYDPKTGARYDRDPRSIAYKALQYLKTTGLGDTAFFGPEPEFFIFDNVSYESSPNQAYYSFNSIEAPWTSGEAGHGHKIGHKMGYFPTTPQDTLMDVRSDIVSNMIKMGMDVFIHHHEVATAGQCEIGVKFNELIPTGDNVFKLKYAVKNTAFVNGKTATFMPKPMFGDNGSGMHVHTSIWKDGKNLFAGEEYGGLSKMALFAIGGLIKHGKSIQPFTNPSANSYRRLVPGFEAPVKLAYSASNRSAAIRIPYSASVPGRRIEFRCPDASGNPHIAMAAMLMAMIDGIQKQIHPGQAMDKNIYELPAEEAGKIPSTCAGQEEALREFEKDSEWLKAGDVFSEDMIEAYLGHRFETEVQPMKLRPNPYEYELYYDC